MSVSRKVGLTVGLFAIIGVGLGLSGYISLSFINQMLVEEAEGEFMRGFGQILVRIVALQSAFVFFLLGSVVAAISGSTIAREAGSIREAALSNGAASFVGFYVMVGIASVIMLTALSSGGGGAESSSNQFVNLGEIIMPVLKIGIPTGFVGVGAGGVVFKLR